MSFIGARKDHRSLVAQEMYDTEHSYVTSLKTLVNLYINVLKDSIQKKKPIIKEEEISKIFSNIELLLNINERLLEGLAKSLLGWNEATSCVSPPFLELGPFLKMYTEYCLNFDQSNSCLAACRKNNKSFEKFLKKAGKDIQNKQQSIESYLIMPVQRLPRYVLLLQDMLKHTSNSHPDYLGLQQALSQIKLVADSVNEGVRVAEQRARLLLIEQELHMDVGLVQPHRFLIKQETFKVVQNPQRGSLTMYLLNDLLILGDAGLKVDLVPLHLIIVVDTEPNTARWTMLLPDSTVMGKYVFESESAANKKEWIEIINKTINDICTIKLAAKKQRSDLRERLQKQKEISDSRRSLSQNEIDIVKKKEVESKKAEKKMIKQTKDSDKFNTFRF